MKKKFDCKIYTLRSYASDKKDATKKASIMRNNGIKARVVKRSNGNYLIYGRVSD
jgi:hypothetical protein